MYVKMYLLYNNSNLVFRLLYVNFCEACQALYFLFCAMFELSIYFQIIILFYFFIVYFFILCYLIL